MTGDPTTERGAAAAGVPSLPATETHVHTWGLMQFELVDDHPVVRQRCEACGFVRRYRAWERYWTPDAHSPGSAHGRSSAG